MSDKWVLAKRSNPLEPPHTPYKNFPSLIITLIKLTILHKNTTFSEKLFGELKYVFIFAVENNIRCQLRF